MNGINNKALSSSSNLSALTAVNFHFTRKCNYNCGFCFHTSKTSHIESMENIKLILKAIKDEGCLKINFAGGEPFLYASKLGEMVKYCKQDLKFDSVSIISNGYHVKDEWFQKYAKYLDILGISCDSFDENVNKSIGRGNGSHVKSVTTVSRLCQQYNIKFKLNTVINAYNYHEDMNDAIDILQPFRWKLFQVLPIEGENSGENAKRDVSRFLITSEQFKQFIDCHQLRQENIMKVEDNSIMRSSYILVDEYGRFLDPSLGRKDPTDSILKVGIKQALDQLLQSNGGGFDAKSFKDRDGFYPESWSNNLVYHK